jgi:hypothetical protein
LVGRFNHSIGDGLVLFDIAVKGTWKIHGGIELGWYLRNLLQKYIFYTIQDQFFVLNWVWCC